MQWAPCSLTQRGRAHFTQFLRVSSRFVASPLAERFRALFTLRNISCDESAIAITGGLYYSLLFHQFIVIALNDASALLKHECAYCLGQMQVWHTCMYFDTILTSARTPSLCRTSSSAYSPTCMPATVKHVLQDA